MGVKTTRGLRNGRQIWRLGTQVLDRVSHLQDVASPEEVEVVGRGGAVGHDVIDVDQLLDGELVSQLGEILGVI